MSRLLQKIKISFGRSLPKIKTSSQSRNEKEQIPMPIVEKFVGKNCKKHRIRKFKARKEDQFSCTLCETNIPKNGRLYSCRKCYFVLCNSCFVPVNSIDHRDNIIQIDNADAQKSQPMKQDNVKKVRFGEVERLIVNTHEENVCESFFSEHDWPSIEFCEDQMYVDVSEMNICEKFNQVEDLIQPCAEDEVETYYVDILPGTDWLGPEIMLNDNPLYSQMLNREKNIGAAEEALCQEMKWISVPTDVTSYGNISDNHSYHKSETKNDYITIHDLQGEWVNDCGDEFNISGTNLQFFDADNEIFEITEKDDYFIFNDSWILEKKSDVFMWTFENEEPVFWYRQITNESVMAPEMPKWISELNADAQVVLVSELSQFTYKPIGAERVDAIAYFMDHYEMNLDEYEDMMDWFFF